MTCAHVVHVALKKVAGVESVDVSLNQGLASIKLKPGNTVSVPQLWEVIHHNGYTPKTTTVSVRGELTEGQGPPQLKVSGTNQVLALAVETKKAAVQNDLRQKRGQSVILQGVLVPGKDLQIPVPLQVSQVK
jgi:copper chaperone CopZ